MAGYRPVTPAYFRDAPTSSFCCASLGMVASGTGSASHAPHDLRHVRNMYPGFLVHLLHVDGGGSSDTESVVTNAKVVAATGAVFDTTDERAP